MKIIYPSEKIEEFTKKCLSKSPIGVDHDAEKVTYRNFHRLLILDHHLQTSGAVGGREFARECVADASLAYLLFFLNLNKASLSSLRSAIENSWRYLLKRNGGSPEIIDSVPVLVSDSRSLNLYSGLSTEIVNNSYYYYKDLCQAVHSSKEDYLTNDIPFQNLTSFKKEKSILTVRMCGNVFRNLLETLVVADYPIVQKLEAKNFDALMDGLPKKMKRALSGS